MTTKLTACIGRDPLMHGSRACADPRGKHSDLCERHARLIAPNQLISGVFYAGRDEEAARLPEARVFPPLPKHCPECPDCGHPITNCDRNGDILAAHPTTKDCVSAAFYDGQVHAEERLMPINPRPIQQGVEVRGVVATAINHGSDGWVTLKCEGRVLTGADREALLGATVRVAPEGG